MFRGPNAIYVSKSLYTVQLSRGMDIYVSLKCLLPGMALHGCRAYIEHKLPYMPCSAMRGVL